MTHPETITVCDPAQTAGLLDFPSLLAALSACMAEYAAGRIASPERMAVPLPGGGVMLSMPAVAIDIAAHKLVTVVPANAARGLPTISGHVTALDAVSGETLLLLDGPEVTGRRTAAVTMLAIRAFMPAGPKEILLIGTGTQARYHVRAIAAVFPEARVRVRGLRAADAAAFCDSLRPVLPSLAAAPADHVPDAVDAVIAVTTSTVAVYDEPPRAGRVVVGVGAFRPDMAEIGSTTLLGSQIYADDQAGVSAEAGDLIQAGVDWRRVLPLASALGKAPDPARPVVVKSVGTAAWDLAACRVALANLARRGR
ncbi:MULTISPECIES: bifunctional Delta(1)-pyrroline-2-carboxylate/Delta(1)-piperideine-2-carboxylate reductase [Cupriavidus]